MENQEKKSKIYIIDNEKKSNCNIYDYNKYYLYKTVLDASCYTSCISGLQTVLNSPLKTTPNDKIYSLCYNKCTKREKRDWYE